MLVLRKRGIGLESPYEDDSLWIPVPVMEIMSAVNWSELKVSRIRGKSRLISCMAVSPLKVFNPKIRSDFCFAVLSNYGGGFVQGDQINIKIDKGKLTVNYSTNQYFFVK